MLALTHIQLNLTVAFYMLCKMTRHISCFTFKTKLSHGTVLTDVQFNSKRIFINNGLNLYKYASFNTYLYTKISQCISEVEYLYFHVMLIFRQIIDTSK
jgi:hypothetical protein